MARPERIDVVQKLRNAVDLVVVIPFWERQELLPQVRQPWRIAGQKSAPVFQLGGLRRYTGKLVSNRVAGAYAPAATNPNTLPDRPNLPQLRSQLLEQLVT